MPEETQESPQESLIAQPWQLPAYLDAMENDVSTQKERYAHEIEAITELGQLFDKLAEAWRPKDRPLTDQEQLRLVLFFAVKNQMYGGVFSLLRLRTVDAMNGTRFAIEATGIAHLLWKKSNLFQTYMTAYPNIVRDGAANQWKPSKKYKALFNTREIFVCLQGSFPELAKRMRQAYAIISYRASHAGRGILHNLKIRDGKVFYHANELDQTEIDRSWGSLAVGYFEMARVFAEIFKQHMTPENFLVWIGELEGWDETFLKPLARKAMARREATPVKQPRSIPHP
jgi:hypothetical protein